MTTTKDEYIFFWDGIYSQWNPSDFYDFTGRHYNCAEQYMMSQKASLFKDWDIYEQIMQTKMPNEQKALGKKVKNFDVDEWNENAIDIVTFGNYLKFTQNEKLFAELKSSGTRHIVEASPYDPVWGIGLGASTPNIEDQSTWKGTNWLGISIMRARLMLFGTRCEHEGCMG